MHLRRRGVYVALIVANVLIAALVIEPVHEVGADLGQARLRDDVGLPVVLVRGRREDSAIDAGCGERERL